MLSQKGMQRARSTHPDMTGLTADPMLRHPYGGQLEAAAESFLITAFEQGGRGPLGEEGVPPVLVAAAMHVLNRAAWTQPSDEQVKAAMFLSQQAKQPEAPCDAERRAA